MQMRVSIVVLALLGFGAQAGGAAALSWQPVETVDVVRGVPAPTAAIDAQGKAVVAYSNNDRLLRGMGWSKSRGPLTVLAVRDSGGRFLDAGSPFDGDEQALAVNQAGATAIALVRGGQVHLASFAAPGVSNGRSDSPGADGVQLVAGAVLAATEPDVGIDGAGGATVAWLAREAGSIGGSPNAIQVRRPGGSVESLSSGDGPCSDLSVDVNSRGDAVVAAVCDGSARVFFSAAGTADFGPAEQPFVASGTFGPIARLGVALDGGGRVHAFVNRGPGAKRFVYHVFSAVRPPVGPFGGARELSVSLPESFDMDVREDGRAIAAWGAGPGEVRYAIHGADGALGPASTVAARGFPVGVKIATSPGGPAIISWLEGDVRTFDTDGEGPSRANVVAATIASDGKAANPRRLAVPGDIRSLPVFAINGAGQAVGTWEQRCSPRGAFAVMAVASDDAGEAQEPPCQDTKAPKVIAPRRRAILKRRALRVRVACDEVCNATASARVLTPGRRAPIGKGKTRGERRLSARRGATLALWLTPVSQRRIARALRRGRKATLRLSVSVRDVYGNGRRWRFRLPLGR